MIFGENLLGWAVLGGLALTLASIVWIVFLELRLKKLFRGRKAEDLQKTLSEIQGDLEYFSRKEREMDSFLEHVERRLKRSAQHMGMVRFNPYEGIGGDQSFSIAVLDEQKNGFVITGLYGRESNRIYAKPVEKGESSYQLSEEEKAAIEKAVGRYA